jgi:hypothetical protein
VPEAEHQLPVGVSALKRRHHVLKEKRLLEGDAGSQPHATRSAGTEISDLCAELLGVAERALRQVVQRLARRGQVHPATPVHQQPRAERALQRPNMEGDRRLAQGLACRRSRVAALLHDHREDLQPH